jgi:exosortase
MSAVAATAPEATRSLAAPRVNWPFVALLAGVWAWSLGVCIPFWNSDPNYSYGWVVPPLIVFFLWRRLGELPEDAWNGFREMGGRTGRISPWLLALPALGLFPLEVYRTEYFQSGIVLWAINLGTVALTLAGAWWLGGTRLLLIVLFPIVFFLTAVPWPALVAVPVQQKLMQAVASVVSEMLLWLGKPVTLEGAQLHLSKGTVGIVEACSGIRSLQSGLMVSLAVGELLLLTRTRRVGLVASGIILALLSNLARTFTLCWIMDEQGDAAMHKAHDMVGNIAMYSFYVLIYCVGKLLETNGAGAGWPAGGISWRERFDRLRWTATPNVKPMLATALLMFLAVHAWYYALRLSVKPQTEPQFTARVDPSRGVAKLQYDETVWNKLGPSSGEQLTYQTPAAPSGSVSGYHLFWKPSPMSRIALGHRPDICMPGSGWEPVGKVEEVKFPIGGVPLTFHVFRFRRADSDYKAVQVWGVWRNGQDVEMDYSQHLAASPEKFGPLPTSRHLLGVELVSCFMPYRGEEAPPVSLAEKALNAMFDYKPFAPAAAN